MDPQRVNNQGPIQKDTLPEMKMTLDNPFELDDVDSVNDAILKREKGVAKGHLPFRAMQTICTGIGLPLISLGIIALTTASILVPPVAIVTIALGGAFLMGSALASATVILDTKGDVIRDVLLPQLAGVGVGLAGLTCICFNGIFLSAATTFPFMLVLANMISMPFLLPAFAGGYASTVNNMVIAQDKSYPILVDSFEDEDVLNEVDKLDDFKSKASNPFINRFSSLIGPNPFSFDNVQSKVEDVKSAYDNLLSMVEGGSGEASSKMDSILAHYNTEEGFNVPQTLLQSAYHVYKDCKEEEKAKFVLFTLAQGQIDSGQVSVSVLKELDKYISDENEGFADFKEASRDYVEERLAQLDDKQSELKISLNNIEAAEKNAKISPDKYDFNPEEKTSLISNLRSVNRMIGISKSFLAS